MVLTHAEYHKRQREVMRTRSEMLEIRDWVRARPEMFVGRIRNEDLRASIASSTMSILCRGDFANTSPITVQAGRLLTSLFAQRCCLIKPLDDFKDLAEFQAACTKEYLEQNPGLRSLASILPLTWLCDFAYLGVSDGKRQLTITCADGLPLQESARAISIDANAEDTFEFVFTPHFEPKGSAFTCKELANALRQTITHNSKERPVKMWSVKHLGPHTIEVSQRIHA
jgi:hypothetical protein